MIGGMPQNGDWIPAARRRAVAVALVALAGAVVLVLAGGSTAAVAVGWAVVGIAATLAVGLVFFEIGLSEDRERERAASAGHPPSARPVRTATRARSGPGRIRTGRRRR